MSQKQQNVPLQPVVTEGVTAEMKRTLPPVPKPLKPKPTLRAVKTIQRQEIRRTIRVNNCPAGHDVPACLRSNPHCCSDCWYEYEKVITLEVEHEDWEMDVEDET